MITTTPAGTPVNQTMTGAAIKASKNYIIGPDNCNQNKSANYNQSNQATTTTIITTIITTINNDNNNDDNTRNSKVWHMSSLKWGNQIRRSFAQQVLAWGEVQLQRHHFLLLWWLSHLRLACSSVELNFARCFQIAEALRLRCPTCQRLRNSQRTEINTIPVAISTLPSGS